MSIATLVSKHRTLSKLVPFMLGKIQKTLTPATDLNSILLCEAVNYHEHNFSYACPRYLLTKNKEPRPLLVEVKESRNCGYWNANLISIRDDGKHNYLLSLTFPSYALAALASNAMNAEFAY